MNLNEYLAEEAKRHARLARYGHTVGLLESAFLTTSDVAELRATDGADAKVNRRIADNALAAFIAKFGLRKISFDATRAVIADVDLRDIEKLAAWIGTLEFLDAMGGGSTTSQGRQELLLAHAEDFVARHHTAAAANWTFHYNASAAQINVSLTIRNSWHHSDLEAVDVFTPEYFYKAAEVHYQSLGMIIYQPTGEFIVEEAHGTHLASRTAA